MPGSTRPVAFVLSGGGSFGAMQVGMLRALVRHGVRPAFVVGASVGALNGLWFAASPDEQGIDGLTRLWLDLQDHEVFPLSARGRKLLTLGLNNHVFPLRPLTIALGVLGRRDHLVPNDRFRQFLSEHLPVSRLEEVEIPLHVVATDVLTGRMVTFDRGEALPRLLASAAVPGAFPPVEVEGRLLMDGGVANNTPIDHAVSLGADDVYVLPSGLARPLDDRPDSALGLVGHALGLVIEQRLLEAAARYDETTGVTLRVLPAFAPRVIPLDFSRTGWLIDEAERLASEWLESEVRPGPGTS